MLSEKPTTVRRCDFCPSRPTSIVWTPLGIWRLCSECVTAIRYLTRSEVSSMQTVGLEASTSTTAPQSGCYSITTDEQLRLL